MDDKTPTPDQTPVDRIPADHTPVEQPHEVGAVPAVAEPAPSAPAAPKRGRKRALLIGGGIAAAVILAGGGVAVGAAIGDEFGEDDDRGSVSEGPRDDDDDRAGDSGAEDADDEQSASTGGQGPVTGIGAESADELIDIAAAARGVAEGDVTSIDAKRDGTWEVQVTTANGEETEVHVDKQLAATVVAIEAADDDDTAPALSLDDETIRALVSAALDEADGMITDLDVDSDEVSPYDASVLTTDNRSIDIDFSAEFAVVGTGTDS